MRWSEMKNERDAEGNLTPVAMALESIAEYGCHCGDDCESVPCHTCRCEDALKAQWHQLNCCYDLIGRLKQKIVEMEHGADIGRARVIFEEDGDTVVQLGHWAHRFELKYVDQAAHALALFIQGADEEGWDDDQPEEHKDPDVLQRCQIWDLTGQPETWSYGMLFLFSRQIHGGENEKAFFSSLMMGLTISDHNPGPQCSD